MKLQLFLVAGALFAGATAYADTLNTGGGFNTSTGTLSAFSLGTLGSCSPGCIDGSPFFDNTSGDLVAGTHLANAGDFLDALGSFAGGTNNLAGGGQMYTQTQAAGSPNYASAFSFIRQAASLSITILYANSSVNNNAEFGIYDASSQSNALNNHEIVQPITAGSNLNNLIGQTYNITQNYGVWGIYARTCDVNAADHACPGGNVVTYFSNVALNGVNGDTTAADAAANHMHWALFQSGTNAAVYYLALEDYAFQGAETRNVTEGFGDYNDLILRIDTSGVPEPATLSIMGLGLAGLGMLGRRKLKK